MKQNFYSAVFGWLFIGLLITAITGIATLYSPTLLEMIFSTSGYIVLVIVQLVIAVVLSTRIYKMNPNTAKVLYILYTALTGLTFSSIFILFEIESIIFILLITALLFGVFALIGKCTKVDLSKFGIYLFIGLIAIIVLEIINIFILNNTLNMAASIIGVVVFLGYTAYDMQRIGYMADNGTTNLAIIGAFSLYLDFINLFLDLLNLFGRERD